MSRVRLCPECGVPRHISKQIVWRNNGTIAQRRNPDHRSVILESDNIYGLFKGIEETIGISIEHIVVESRRRSTYDFLDNMLPAAAKTVVRLMGARPVARSISKVGRELGYGDIKLTSIRRVHGKGDYMTMCVEKPYSLPLICGDVAGAMEVFDRRECGVSYKEISPDVYEVTAHVSTHPLELKERLGRRPYTYKEGDVGLERCSRCGAPRALSQFEYHMDRGIIVDKSSGRRMAGLGAAALEAVFDELEKELGETFPQVLIEAQRRFVTAGFYSREEITRERDFRKHFALRGLGNLREMEFGDQRLRFHLENPCLHLMLVGLFLGFFELVFEQEGKVEWELAEDGDLEVEISPQI